MDGHDSDGDSQRTMVDQDDPYHGKSSPPKKVRFFFQAQPPGTRARMRALNPAPQAPEAPPMALEAPPTVAPPMAPVAPVAPPMAPVAPPIPPPVAPPPIAPEAPEPPPPLPPVAPHLLLPPLPPMAKIPLRLRRFTKGEDDLLLHLR